MTQTMDGFNEAGTFETNWHTLKKALFYSEHVKRMQYIPIAEYDFNKKWL